MTGAAPWHATPFSSPVGAELTAAWLAALGEADSTLLTRRLGWGTATRPAEPCRWPAALEALRAAIRDSSGLPLLAVEAGTQLPFVDLWQPAVSSALAALRRRLEPSVGGAVATSAWESISAALLDRLCTIAAPALWELFNRDRGPQVMLLAHLDDGALPREVYGRFIHRLRSDGLTALLEEFPVLGRLLGTVVDLWADSATELLLRLRDDRSLLAAPEGLAVDPTVALIDVAFGLSDPHRDGRSVAILTFGHGHGRDSRRVVYKPKDLRVDAAYQGLLDDLNRHTPLPALRTLRMLTRDGYGYVEFLPHRSCENLAQREAFYRNAGRLTAVLYALGCTDGHHENLIAHGDQWVLIDTETLFEGELTRLDAHGTDDDAAGTSGLTRAIAQSVLASGLLPTWQFVGPQRLAKDVSALGVASALHASRLVEGWVGINTDGMMAGAIEVLSAASASLPVGIGEANPFDDHLDAFLDGFRTQAHALVERRSAWLGGSGLLARFEGLPRRVVLRSTHVYFAILQQLTHPSALVSNQAQGLVLEQLARPFLGAKTCPRHWPIFDAELRQLEQLDIPFFTHAMDGTQLSLARGMEPLDDFIRTRGLELSRARLGALDAAAIDFQCRLVIGAAQARRVRSRGSPAPLGPLSARPALSAEGRLARAETMARQLRALAVLDHDRTPHWLGMDLGADGEKLCFGAVGLSLYGGSAGVALLEAALARAGLPSSLWEPSAMFTPLATLASSGDDSALRRLWRSQPLGIAGTGGVLLSLLELDRLGAPAPRGFDSHRALALRLLSGASDARLAADLTFDVMGGPAGLVGALLQLQHPLALEWAVKAGRLLLTRQLDTGGWPPSAPHPRTPLTGFSHGAAGPAAALGRLHQHTGDPAFLAGARRALDFERSCFDGSRGNWPDFRLGGEPAFTTTWCHGAPGIALSRLALCDTPLDDAQLRRELDVALSTTAATEPELDHLCCGAMGLSAILRVAGRRLEQQRWAEAANRLEAGAVCRAEARGGFSVFSTRESGVLLPGFMTGLSGIALALMPGGRSEAAVERLLSAGLLEAVR